MNERVMSRFEHHGTGRVLTLCLVAGSMAALNGCSWSQPPQQEIVEELPILWEKSGSYCNRTAPLRLVARNQAEMALCPISDVPVDFDRQMVLAATMGQVLSDGYAIRIERVYREGPFIKVDVRIYRPPPVTQPGDLRPACPYHVVVVPRSDLNVENFSPDPHRATPRRWRKNTLQF